MAMSSICGIVIYGFLGSYVLALIVFAIGTLGLFGQEPDPLSGVFLIPLGLPWNRFIDAFPESLWPWLAAACPAVNYVILRMICRLVRIPHQIS
jgi:hypothetical protein